MTISRAPGWTNWLVRKVCPAAVAASLLFGAVAPVHAAPDDKEIERLYLEGQEYFEANDFVRAADSWTRLLNLLPESGDNQHLRESVIINILDAHLQAYNLVVDSGGKKDVEHLQAGKATLDQYYADFKKVHGNHLGIAAAVQEKAAVLESTLERALAQNAPPKTDPTPEDPKPSTRDGRREPTGQPQVIVIESQNQGTGLIVGGSVLGVLGLGAAGLLAYGVVEVQDALTDYNAARNRAMASGATMMDLLQAQTDLDDATDRGNRGEALAITGGVLMPLFLGAGAAMIVFGIKARRKAQLRRDEAVRGVSVVTPVLTPGFGGFRLQGRF